MVDLRREVKNLVDKCGGDVPAIASKLGLTPSAIYAWLNGERGINKRNLKKLQELAEGKKLAVGTGPEISYQLSEQHYGVIKDAPGRFTQLTEQVALLQTYCGKLEERIKALEEKFKASGKKSEPAHGTGTHGG